MCKRIISAVDELKEQFIMLLYIRHSLAFLKKSLDIFGKLVRSKEVERLAPRSCLCVNAVASSQFI